MRPLDSLGFGSVSLPKIDVEGFKDEVLASAERLISESRPVILTRYWVAGPIRGLQP